MASAADAQIRASSADADCRHTPQCPKREQRGIIHGADELHCWNWEQHGMMEAQQHPGREHEGTKGAENVEAGCRGHVGASQVQRFTSAKREQLSDVEWDIQLKIIHARLQLLQRQRELSSVKCEHFTVLLEEYQRDPSSWGTVNTLSLPLSPSSASSPLRSRARVVHGHTDSCAAGVGRRRRRDAALMRRHHSLQSRSHLADQADSLQSRTHLADQAELRPSTPL